MWPRNDKVCQLLLWQNPKHTGIVFGLGLVFLLAVRYVSLLSVVGNLSLALLTTTMAFRIYKSVLAAVNKSNEGHPFKTYLESDLHLSTDKAQEVIDSITGDINGILQYLKRVFLIDNVVESVKFAALMYIVIVVGRWINGLTFVTIAWVKMFALPKIYHDNQKAIDDALMPLKKKVDDALDKIKASMPAAFPQQKKTE